MTTGCEGHLYSAQAPFSWLIYKQIEEILQTPAPDTGDEDGKPCYLFACWVIFHAFVSSADFFQNKFFWKILLRNTIRVSNSLDPDQAYILSGLIWVQTVCKSLSADDTSR